MPALHRRAAEEPTVEERHCPERGRGGRPLAHRRVERSKEERPQHAVVESATAIHAPIELVRDERGVAVQPTFGFEEREKQQPRGLEQRELAAYLARRAIGRIGECAERTVERAIEADGEGLAAECLDPARVREDVAIAGGGTECAKRFGVAVDEA